MPVAKVPGQPRQRGNVGSARFNQWLGRGHHFDQSAIVEQQTIVGAQPNLAVQLDVDGHAFDAYRRPLRRATLRVIENDSVSHGAVTVTGCDNASGARHGVMALV